MLESQIRLEDTNTLPIFIIGCYAQNSTQVLELLVFPMVGNLAVSLSAKTVALGFEFWLWGPYVNIDRKSVV